MRGLGIHRRLKTPDGTGHTPGSFAALRVTGWTAICAASFALAGCHRGGPEPGTVVVILSSSPNNLDLRQGTDAQSERVGSLIFDSLVKKDEQDNLVPWLASSWEQPDALTWVFHLRDGVRFQDGRPLEAADVVWTIESLVDPKLAGLISSKSGSFAAVASVEARDRLTAVVHLKRPDAGLLFNLSDGLFGVVPRGAGKDFGLHPVGSGAFRFASQQQDKEVVVERVASWSDGLEQPAFRAKAAKDGASVVAGAVAGAGAEAGARIERVVFTVVPDAITSALELQKGSADVGGNVLTLDMVHALESSPNLAIASGPSTFVYYINLNVRDAALGDKRVRQAVALAIDRPAIVAALWRGHAEMAGSLLPKGHWAKAADSAIAQYPHDPARAAALLEAAGFHAGADGIRLHLTLKTSTDEAIRLLAAVLQQQMRAAGIRLDLRSAEFGTFYSDVTKGAFQMYVLGWVGSNEDPDIFRYMYSSASFPPKGANRGHYVNARVDALLTAAAGETDQGRRREDYVEIQKIVADEMPSIPLWFPDNEIVHTRRVRGVTAWGSGNYDFLRTARIR